MKIENTDLNKYLESLSFRHHYIPKFLINGFSNSNGLLYLYDKQKDEIFKNPRPAKSIFFENDRNTLHLDDTTKTSIIEDLLYKGIDDRTSKVIKLYQTQEISKIDFNPTDTSTFLFFLISLFWRIPKTDYAANNLMDRAIITTNGIDPEILRNDLAYRKMNRAGLFKHHIAEIKRSGAKGEKIINIQQAQNEIYLLGDYPILFRKQPYLFSEFNDTDILMAISSNRIYSSTLDKLHSISLKHSLQYNACIIEQSVNYVAGGDLEILKCSILLHKELKASGLIYGLNDMVFRTMQSQ